MKKKADIDNVVHILEGLINHLDECEFYDYDDAEDMDLAKKEVLKILDNLIKRRSK